MKILSNSILQNFLNLPKFKNRPIQYTDHIASEYCINCGIKINNPFNKYKLYCTIKCKKNSNDRNSYYKKLKNPIKNMIFKEKRKKYLKHWRQNNFLKGNCTKCGKSNDRKNENYKTCTNCQKNYKLKIETWRIVNET